MIWSSALLCLFPDVQQENAQPEVYLKLETRGFEYIKEIERAMERAGYGYKRW